MKKPFEELKTDEIATLSEADIKYYAVNNLEGWGEVEIRREVQECKNIIARMGL